jgi:zinc D-Ala-D-Ala carboxypeptidase
MLQSDNFSQAELERSDTARKRGIDNSIPPTLHSNANRLLETLECARAINKRRMKVQSGYRCSALNKAVGGAAGSRHQECLAADVNVQGMSPRALYNSLKSATFPFHKIILEFDRWVHISAPRDGEAPLRQFLIASRVGGQVKYELDN